MSDASAKAAFAEIDKYLNDNHLGMAAKAIGRLLETTGQNKFRGELEQAATGYKYMVQFLLSNGGDDGRASFFAKTKEELRMLTDRLSRELEVSGSGEIYFAQVRSMRMSSISLSDTIAAIRRCADIIDDEFSSQDKLYEQQRIMEQNLINLFNYVWTTFPLSSGDVALLSETGSDGDAPFALRAQIISALLLGLLQYYEKGRVEALLDIYDKAGDVAIQARALMALVLGMYAQRDRIEDDQQLTMRLGVWADDADNTKRLRTVVMDIVRTLDTERINKELREDFLPRMQQMKPHLDNLLKGGQERGLEENPEWEEILKKSGLEGKLKELTELQNEGADLMMFAFSNLKNFGFFNELSNWFLPFDVNHSQLRGAIDNVPESMIQVLETPGMMCDSDKYSFALSLSRLPAEQRDMMFSQLGSNEEALRDAMTEVALAASSTEKIFTNESARYIRDINRFLKLFRERRQFRDMLRHPFVLGDIPFPPEAISADMEFVRIVGEFYLRRGYYDDASKMFAVLEKHDGADAGVLEKLGYCYQQLHRYEEALAEYRKAELFNSDSLWLIKRLAAVSRQLRRYADASEYYTRALEREPENVAMLMNLAACKVELGEYSEALKLYYKVNYLKPQHLNSLRAIAWTEFLAGNYEKSCEIHDKVIVSSDEQTDRINAGHAWFARGDIGKAVEHYQAAAANEEGLRLFNEIMSADRKVLEKSGCAALDISIVVDKVNSSYPNN